MPEIDGRSKWKRREHGNYEEPLEADLLSRPRYSLSLGIISARMPILSMTLLVVLPAGAGEAGDFDPTVTLVFIDGLTDLSGST